MHIYMHYLLFILSILWIEFCRLNVSLQGVTLWYSFVSYVCSCWLSYETSGYVTNSICSVHCVLLTHVS